MILRLYPIDSPIIILNKKINKQVARFAVINNKVVWKASRVFYVELDEKDGLLWGRHRLKVQYMKLYK